MKDAVATMGDLLPPDAGGRDAVHVAVVSAIADGNLSPGQDVGIALQDGDRDVIADKTADPIGIVDPFLKRLVLKGERFWIYLYPRSITGLNHVWTHPAFPEAGSGEIYNRPNTKLTSEQWLRQFVKDADCPSYEVVLGKCVEIADGHNDAWDDNYMHFNDIDAHGEIPDEFWKHMEVVLGRPIRGRKPQYFSCSC